MKNSLWIYAGNMARLNQYSKFGLNVELFFFIQDTWPIKIKSKPVKILLTQRHLSFVTLSFINTQAFSLTVSLSLSYSIRHL